MNTQTGLAKIGFGILATLAMTGSHLGIQKAFAQQVVNVAPTGQAVAIDSTIAWQFDEVSAVDASSIRIYLNDQDVTSQSIIDASRNYFGYRPAQPLTPGTYEVRVEFSNTQGANFIARWPFAVADAALEITSITHNAADQPLGSGASFLATIDGTPGVTAAVLLVQNGQTVRTVSAAEVSNGVYVASIAVGTNDVVDEGILVGRLAQGNQVVYSVASQAFAFSPNTTATEVSQSQTSGDTQPTAGVTQTEQTPLTLEVTSHSNNGGVSGSSGFTLAGMTIPNATITVTVTASAPTVGGFLSIGSDQTLLDNARASVDAEGGFSIGVPRPAILQAGTQYTIEVTASRDGETEVVELTLVQQ